jgi:hypothetical protein
MKTVKVIYEVCRPTYMNCGVLFRRLEILANGSKAGYTWPEETLGM